MNLADGRSVPWRGDPGAHHVRAFVLRGATLMRIDFDVLARRREDARLVTIDVPRREAPDDPPEGDDPAVPQPLD